MITTRHARIAAARAAAAAAARSLSTTSQCPVTGTASTPSSGNGNTTNHVQLREVPALPYLGSMLPPYSRTPPFDPTKFYDFYPAVRRRYGDFYKIGVPGLGKGVRGEMYVLTDPTEMQKVLRQERGRRPYPRGVIEAEWPLVHWLQSRGSILGKGTNEKEDALGFAGRGATWKRLRTFLQTDLLSPQAAAGYVPIMAEAAQLASNGAPAAADDLNAYTNRCSFDLFNSIMFGQLTKMADPATGNDAENIRFCQASVSGMDLMFQQLTAPGELIWFNLGIRTRLYKEMAAAFDIAHQIADQKYAEFRKRSEADALTDAEKASYLGRAIVRQAEEGSNISEHELSELINVSLIAAIDTTSSMLSWNMLHLALNPAVQEKLHDELFEAVEKCGGLNAEALRRAHAPYLHAVLRETHRLTPAGPLTMFKENSLADIEIHGTVVPKDSLFAFDGYSVGLDAVDDPLEFRPERWLPDAVAARKGTPAEVLDHPFYRDAFSQGSRKCPGSRVANNEVLLLIARLVLDWRMGPPAGYSRDDVTYVMHGMVHPNLPQLTFEAREGVQ